MSNEPMFSEPMSSEPADLPAPGAPASAEFSADAASVLAALGRMEAAIRGERTALGRLRDALGGMANAIAQAKSALQQVALKPDATPEGMAFAMLLDELEHRVDAMIEIAGGGVPDAKAVSAPATAAQPMPAEQPAPIASPPALGGGERARSDVRSEPRAGPPADQVPTVSEVVSRLGRSHDAQTANEDTARPAGAGVPTVSMLATMVLALSAPTAPSPEASAPAAAPATPATDAAPAMELAAEATAAAANLMEPATAEPKVAISSPAAVAATAAEPVPPATEALSPAADAEATQTIAVPVQVAPAFAVNPILPILQVLPEADLLASFAALEALPILPPEAGSAVIFATRTAATAPESQPETAAAQEPPQAEREAIVSPPDVDLDLTAFLFGPEPAPSNAETAPLPAPSYALPTVDLVTPSPAFVPVKQASPPGAPQPLALASAAAKNAPAKPALADPHDPLAPLKSLSAEETIALFS